MCPTAAASTSPGWVAARDADVAPGRGVARPPALGVLAHEGADVAPRRAALVVAGQRQHALDRRLEAVEGAQALVQHDGAVRARGVQLGLDRDAHRRHRRAQLVRHVRGERALAAQQLADAVAGVGERGAELVELADPGLRRRRPGVVAADRRRPLAEPLDGPAQAPRQEGADDAGDGDDRHAGEPEQQHAAAHSIVALRARLADPDGADDLAVAVQRGGRDQLVADVGLVRQAVERRRHRLVGHRRTAALECVRRRRRTRRSRDPAAARRRAARSGDCSKRVATMLASRCSSSRSLRWMPLRTAIAAGTRKARTANVVTSRIVTRIRRRTRHPSPAATRSTSPSRR